MSLSDQIHPCTYQIQEFIKYDYYNVFIYYLSSVSIARKCISNEKNIKTFYSFIFIYAYIR